MAGNLELSFNSILVDGKPVKYRQPDGSVTLGETEFSLDAWRELTRRIKVCQIRDGWEKAPAPARTPGVEIPRWIAGLWNLAFRLHLVRHKIHRWY